MFKACLGGKPALTPHRLPVCVGTLDPAKIPQHVAIIMDGNRRWGKRVLIQDKLRGAAGSVLGKFARASADASGEGDKSLPAA